MTQRQGTTIGSAGAILEGLLEAEKRRMKRLLLIMDSNYCNEGGKGEEVAHRGSCEKIAILITKKWKSRLLNKKSHHRREV